MPNSAAGRWLATIVKRMRGGEQRRQVWAMNQAALSPAYTTR
ncbi:DUF4113 domain-containing protein [Xanthomonas campestris pv. raphani]|nr:DUF4113 domain-containing protein [Xanthomonas campestris pv. raphani]